MEEIFKLKAKSTGQGLIDHSVCVYNITKVIVKTLNLDDNDLIKDIYCAALLHDIGKAYHKFQNYITNNEETETNNILHHQISWCFSKLIFPNTRNIMSNAIYWHHPEPFSEKKIKMVDIYKELSKEDINLMVKIINYYHDLYPNLFKNVTNNDLMCPDNYDTTGTPDFFYVKELDSHKESLNEKLILIRSVLNSADRIASNDEYNNNKFLSNDEGYIYGLLNNTKKPQIIDNHPIYSNDVESRFNKQKEIIDSINKHTSIIKAPAGFGKTLLGLLWGLKHEKKILWVCPRNVVVEVVYSSILEELSNLNLNEKISVELFLTGKRIACNSESIDDFSSDIVVTNIDNFLSPTHKNKLMYRAYSILDYNVVFDEFHEFVTTSPIFSLFVDIMNIRNNIIKSNTLLLSATPMILSYLWDTENFCTQVLPNEGKHYDAIHDKKYQIEIISDEIKMINVKGSNKNTLTIYNSIINSQRHTKTNDTKILVHSDFLEEDKKEKLDEIYNIYGKQNIGETNNIEKKSVVSAPIIQASMDISFKHLKESISSPEETMQRIGRNNRWGEYNISTISLYDLTKNRSEKAYIEHVRNLEEQEKWVIFLINNINKNEISLNEIYNIYNQFNIENSRLRKNIINGKLKESYKKLNENISPKKYCLNNKSASERELIKSDNNLRTISEGYFCTFESHDEPGIWIFPPFNSSVVISKEIDLEENTKNFSIIKLINKIRDLDGKNGFKYGYKYYKKRYSDAHTKLFKRARYDQHSPYIGFNKKYSKKYGLAKNEIYND